MTTRTIYLGNPNPKLYERGNMGEPSVLKEEQTVFNTETVIQMSPDSSVEQCVAEIKTIWEIHSHDLAPSYFKCTSDVQYLYKALFGDFGDVPFKGIVE